MCVRGGGKVVFNLQETAAQLLLDVFGHAAVLRLEADRILLRRGRGRRGLAAEQGGSFLVRALDDLSDRDARVLLRHDDTHFERT